MRGGVVKIYQLFTINRSRRYQCSCFRETITQQLAQGDT